jgi:hypothetical protein
MIEIEKPHYSFESSPDALVFEFESVSENKTIRKAVIMKQLKGMKIYFN